MAYIAHLVAKTVLDDLLLAAGLILKSQGKVRRTYTLPADDSVLLVLATDRVSIFDLVLGFLIPCKGEVLTAITIFWNIVFQSAGIKTHMVAYGSQIDSFLPVELRGNVKLQKRAIIVKKLKMFPIEAIVRGYLTGSGLESYQRTGKVCGILLSIGLHDGSKLAYPIFTPTNKASKGHDEHIDADKVALKYPWMPHFALRLYGIMHDYALTLGLILADTKFEFGQDPKTGEIILADEFGTPDSSRIWLLSAWRIAVAKMKSPTGWDKQPLREEGKRTLTPFNLMLNKLDPGRQKHTKWAGEVIFSEQTIGESIKRYATVVELLSGRDLATFQQEVMGIKN
jgi:phosphoribosylaminoimidazole-succinocarboxamide synthase